MAARIAVVDDDGLFRALMRDLLGGERYAVVAYPAAEYAYHALRADPPNLVVLDIHVETPDAGWQLLELLRLDPATAALPLLVCSADALFLGAHAASLRARLRGAGEAVRPRRAAGCGGRGGIGVACRPEAALCSG